MMPDGWMRLDGCERVNSLRKYVYVSGEFCVILLDVVYVGN